MKKHLIPILILVLFLSGIPMFLFGQVTAVGTPKAENSPSNGDNLKIKDFVLPAGDDVLLVVSTRSGESIPALEVEFNGIILDHLFITIPYPNHSSAFSQVFFEWFDNIPTPITADINIDFSGNTSQKIATASVYANVSQTIPMISSTWTTFNGPTTTTSRIYAGSSGDMIYESLSAEGVNNTIPPTFTPTSGQTLVISQTTPSSNPETRLSTFRRAHTGGTMTMSYDVTNTNANGGRGLHIGGVIKSNGLLPVELTNFRAAQENETISLVWTTTTEHNNEGFEVQRSYNSELWDYLQFVAGQGTSFETHHYHITDFSPSPGPNYYRLKQVDYDGQFAYSPVVVVEMVREKGGAIFPTLVQGELTIEIAEDGPCMVRLFDLRGALVLRQASLMHGRQVLDVSGLQPGYYLAVVETGGKTFRERMLKL